jgi:hypothetical protein
MTGLGEAEKPGTVKGAALTVSDSELPAGLPLLSTAVTSTVNVPTAVGVQGNERVFPLLHPAGSPE